MVEVVYIWDERTDMVEIFVWDESTDRVEIFVGDEKEQIG